MSNKYYIRAEVIDLARERLGLSSDEQLAHELKVTSGTISRMRRGESPSFATGIKVLDAAGIGIHGIVRNDPLAA